MNDNCNKLINTMIEKGADPKIFDMPAMRERIENGMIKDMSVNSDGTIDFNGYHMERNKEYKGITLERISEKQGEVHYINNDPIGDNGHAVYSITAEKISINEYGIEEKIEIKEDKGESKDKWENVKFDEIEAPKKRKCFRKDGMIFEYDIDKKTYSEIYDYGYWSIEGDPAFETFSIIYGNAKSVKDVISNFEKNAQKYTEKYPNLKEYYANKKIEILDAIDKKQERLNSENAALKANNEKLQKMLSKSLKFAEKVRNNVVGKVFFGKSANELLGDKDKKIAMLEEGEGEGEKEI